MVDEQLGPHHVVWDMIHHSVRPHGISGDPVGVIPARSGHVWSLNWPWPIFITSRGSAGGACKVIGFVVAEIT